MTARERERLLRRLAQAKDTVEQVNVELLGTVDSEIGRDVDDALAALGRLHGAVEQAR